MDQSQTRYKAMDGLCQKAKREVPLLWPSDLAEVSIYRSLAMAGERLDRTIMMKNRPGCRRSLRMILLCRLSLFKGSC